MVTVRRATLDDKPELFKFIQKAYAGRWQYKIPERWQWEYVDNPFLDGPDLPVWIAVEDDGRVVGQTCTLVEPLKIGDQVYRLGWSVDTYLLPEYRGQGIGFQLQKGNDEANQVFMSLSMSKANRKIKAGLGSVALDPVPEYMRLVRYEPESVHQAALQRLAPQPGSRRQVLSDALRITLADRAASGLLNLRQRGRERRLLPQPDPVMRIEMVDRFGSATDRLWEKLAPHFPIAVCRDALYLNWKYVSQPHARYTRLVAWRGDELCGYVVLRTGQPPEPHIGILVDLFAAPDDQGAIQSLLVYGLHYFQAAMVKDVRAAASLPAYQAVLEAMGFHKFHEAVPMLHCKLDDAACQMACQPDGWFFSKGDHDWDQFPLAR